MAHGTSLSENKKWLFHCCGRFSGRPTVFVPLISAPGSKVRAPAASLSVKKTFADPLRVAASIFNQQSVKTVHKIE